MAAELHIYAGAPHGVKQFADVPVARRYIEGINGWISAQLRGSVSAVHLTETARHVTSREGFGPDESGNVYAD